MTLSTAAILSVSVSVLVSVWLLPYCEMKWCYEPTNRKVNSCTSTGIDWGNIVFRSAQKFLRGFFYVWALKRKWHINPYINNHSNCILCGVKKHTNISYIKIEPWTNIIHTSYIFGSFVRCRNISECWDPSRPGSSEGVSIFFSPVNLTVNRKYSVNNCYLLASSVKSITVSIVNLI